MFILTSFDNITKYDNENYHIKYAIHFPPKQYKEQVLVAPFIPGHNGLIIKSENFENNPEEYRNKLIKIYKTKKERILQWLNEIPKDKNIILFCHCNAEKKIEQINKYGYMLCHSGIVGQIILKFLPLAKIEMDETRKKYLHHFLHPSYDPIKCKKCIFGGIEKCGEWKEYCYGPYAIDKYGGIYTLREKKEAINDNRSNKIVLCHCSTGNNRHLQKKREGQPGSKKIF